MANLDLYNKVRTVPQEACKGFSNGSFSGTDINPMWRIKTLTEHFGVCGIGWYIDEVDRWTETVEGEQLVFVKIHLYIKQDGEWSKPIVGIGGNKSLQIFPAKQGKPEIRKVSDECVDGDCEVLTQSGWIKFRDYDGEIPIAQWDKDTNQISFVKPIRLIHKVSQDTFKKGNIIMTGGHRVPILNQSNKFMVKRAEELDGYEGKSYFDIRSGFLGKPIELTPIQKVGIMLQADGTKHSIDKDGNITWNLSFSKQRKIERAKNLLADAGVVISYEHTSKRTNPNWNPYTQIRFKLGNTDYKKLSNFLPIANYAMFEEEFVFWDGAYKRYIKEGYFQYMTTSLENARYLQTLFAVSGSHSSITIHKPQSGDDSIVYSVYKHLHRSKATRVTRLNESIEVFCVEVPTSFFVVRKENEIFITGNCYKMAYTDAISVACKALGFGGDIYWQNDPTKYARYYNDTPQEQPQYQQAPPSDKPSGRGRKKATAPQETPAQQPVQQHFDQTLQFALSQVGLIADVEGIRQFWGAWKGKLKPEEESQLVDALHSLPFYPKQ